jgi:hypothetical protein
VLRNKNFKFLLQYIVNKIFKKSEFFSSTENHHLESHHKKNIFFVDQLPRPQIIFSGSKICFDVTHIWLYYHVIFRWGYEEPFLIAKETEKNEILKCNLFLLREKIVIFLLFVSFYSKNHSIAGFSKKN